MKLNEALLELKDFSKNKALRMSRWKNREYLYINKDVEFYFHDRNGNDCKIELTFYMVTSDEWEVVDRPKQKVKYYPVLILKHEKFYDLSTYKYKSIEHADGEIYFKVIRLITEIPELIEERDE